MAQSGDSPATAWFRELFESANNPPALKNLRLEWVVEDHYAPGPAELQRMRAEVAGKPEHPQRSMLARFERRAAGKPDRAAHALWWEGNEQWRLSRTAVAVETGEPNPSEYTDFVRAGDLAWVLSPESVTIVAAERPPADQYDYASVSTEAANGVATILYGSLNILSGLNAKISSVAMTNAESWRAELEADEGRRMVANGRWDAAKSRGELDRLDIFVAAAPDSPALSIVYADWQEDPVIGRRVATRIDHLEQGVFARRWKVKPAVSESAAQMKEVFRVPEQGGVDVVRGELKLRSVANHSTGTQVQFDNPASSSPSLVIPIGDDPLRSLRWIGWGVVGLIIVALVAIRMRKASGRRAG